MKYKSNPFLFALTSLVTLSSSVFAADRIKQNNTTALNLAGSWDTLPGSGDVAVWNSTVTGANASALGGTLSWLGIKIVSPAGLVTIGNTGTDLATTTTNVLTLGTSGIDMSAATQNLLINGNLAIGGNQTWSVASGRTLQIQTLNTNARMTGSGNLNLVNATGSGTATFDLRPGSSSSSAFTDQNGFFGYSGNWTINSGVLVKTLRNGQNAWGSGTITLNGGTIAQHQNFNGTWTNSIILQTGSNSTIDDANSSGTRSLKLQGVVSGSGNLTIAETGGASYAVNGGVILTNTNTLSGQVTIAANGVLRVGGIAGATSSDTSAGTSGTLGTATVVNNGTLTLSHSDTWTFANNITSGTGAVTIGGVTGTLVASGGTQVVTISGTNAYTGATTVGQGRLNLTGSLTSATTVQNGGSISGTGSTTGLLTMNAGSSIALAGGATVTSLTSNGVNFAGATTLSFLSAPLAGNYDVVTYGAGGVTNYGNLSSAGYRGTLSDDTGNKKIVFAAGGAGTRTWNTTSGTWGIGTGTNFVEGDQQFYSGDTVIFGEPAAASTITLAGRLIPASVTVNNTTNKITFTGTGGTADITGAGSLTKTGSGTLAITSDQTYSGGTTLSAGTLQVGSASALGSGTVALNGGTLSSDSATARALTNALTIGGDVTLGDAVNNGVLTLSGATNLGAATRQITTPSSVTLSGVISNGDLTKAGTGTLTLSNAGNSFNGSVTINGGQLTAIGSSANTNTAVGASSSSRTVTVNNAGTLMLSGNNVLGNSSQTLANTIKMVVNAGGTLTTNAYNVIGNVDLNGGTLTVTAGSSSTYQTYEFNGSTITVGGTSASTISSTAPSNGGMHIAGTKTLTLDVADVATGTDLTVSAALINGSGDRAGAGSLTKTGAGTLVLTGNNTYTGNTTINGGVLQVTGTGYLYNGGYQNGSTVVTVNAGGTLKLDSFAYGPAGGLGQLADYGARRVINGGTIEVIGGTHSSGNDFNVGAAGGTFRYAPAVTTNTLTLSGNGNSNIAVSGALTVETLGHVAVAEVIEGAGSLTKTGDKSFTLSGTNTYTGATNINAGLLVVNGNISTSSMTTVNNTGTLGGSGTVGALTAMSGGTVSPGNSPGILSAGNTDLQLGSTLALELGGTSAGVDYDRLNVTGTVTLAGLLNLAITGTYANNDLLFLLVNDGGDAISGAFSNYAEGANFTLGGQDWSLTYLANNTGLNTGTFTGGNDVALMAVPEPAAALFGGLGMLCLLRRRRA